MDADAVRGQVLLEESREAVVVLDADGRVIAASRRARQSLEGVREGEPLPHELLGERALVVPYAVDGRTERLVYLSQVGDLAAYEELRSGFTAAVSHELRTPLARLLSLLELALLPGENVADLVEQRAPRGRADPGADRRGALPLRARVRDAGRLARRDRGAARPARDRGRARGAGRSGGRRAPGRRRRAGGRGRTAADAAGRGAEPRRERDPLRRAGRERALSRRARGREGRARGSRTTARASPPPTCRASSSGSTAPTARAPRAAPASASRS